MGLSERQQRMYAYISHFTVDKGRPPTIREIGAHVGISSTSVVNYNLNVLVREGLIAREKEVSRGLRIVNHTGKSMLPGIGVVQIPLLGKIAAGQPIPVPEAGIAPPDEMISLTRDIIQEQEGLFALHVKGNSMIDALINDGDVVVMKKQESANNGDMVAVWLKDEKETTLKRIYREPKRVRLQPMNPTMKPLFQNPENVEIQGKVLLVIRQLQKQSAVKI
ncbi:MAG: repressor LexA [Chloroflexi bacterium]|nr:repressor LexA [Chloroflexota bacterium]MBI3741441.1 repressor LexA [Chloroflexota bacterium]